MCNKTPHKHAAVIKAWADGASVQVRVPDSGRYSDQWEDIPKHKIPRWEEGLEYRIKPEPKPDVVRYAEVLKKYDYQEHVYITDAYPDCFKDTNLKLTFDGETGKLKKAEVIT